MFQASIGISLPSGLAPVLADMGSLLNATGLFPELSKAINLVTGAVEQLRTIPQGLQYEKTYPFTGSEGPDALSPGARVSAIMFGPSTKDRRRSGYHTEVGQMSALPGAPADDIQP